MMLAINLLSVLCLTLLIASQSTKGQPSQRQPGVQAQVSRAGLNYAATVAIDVLEKNLDKQSIPDQSGQAKVVVGKVDYWVTEIRILSFTKPSSTITVNPGSGLTWSLQNAGISFKGRWRYQYKVWFIKIKDSGTFDASVSGASASVTVRLSTLPNGKPTISMLSCSCSIAKVNVKFHGGASWIYNLFSGFVERPLKKALEKEVCKAAEKTINNNAVAQLATLKTSVTIDKKFVIDYSLISNPLFFNGFIQTAHKGEVFYVSDSTPAPFTGPYILTPAPSRMVTVYVNEFLANSLGHVLHKNKVLWYDLTKDDVPVNTRPYFQTTCSSGICFGTLFPSAAEMYPGAIVELNMTTTSAPVLSITSQVISGTIRGRVHVFARLASGSTGNLLSLAVTLTTKVLPSVRGNTILATVSELTPQITVESSEIGDLPEDGLNQLITMAANAFIIPKLNKVGAKGIEIPTVEGITFVGPAVTLTQGAVVVSTDVSYAISGRR